MIKGTLETELSCLFNSMQDVNFYNGSASLDVKLQGKSLIHPFFHLFVYFLVRSCDRSCIPSACKQQKKRQKQVRWKNERERPYVIFFLLQDPIQTVRMHMRMLVWNCVVHMFSWTPFHISCKSFIL